ncbi:MAG: hypothetical protein J5705_06020 [Bacteroidaceae bacterium]|nr:hypothetical protein [Bacteroidaceae bacterium]
MRKFTIYLLIAGLVGFMSCRGNDWDTEEELKALSRTWANDYVDYTLRQVVLAADTSKGVRNGGYVGDNITTTSVLKDSLMSVFHFTKGNEYNHDSVNIICSLLQIRDSIVVKADGYRYSDKYWVHLYTVDPGIVNYEGKFRIDFYENGETTPWAWSETTFEKAAESHYKPYKRNDPKVGRY